MKTIEETIKELDVVYVNKLSEDEISEISFVVRQLVKLHVQKALETASKNAQTKTETNWDEEGTYEYEVIDKDSILYAYSETNIL